MQGNLRLLCLLKSCGSLRIHPHEGILYLSSFSFIILYIGTSQPSHTLINQLDMVCLESSIPFCFHSCSYQYKSEALINSRTAICAIVSSESNPPFVAGSGLTAFTMGTWSELFSQQRHECTDLFQKLWLSIAIYLYAAATYFNRDARIFLLDG